MNRAATMLAVYLIATVFNVSAQQKAKPKKFEVDGDGSLLLISSSKGIHSMDAIDQRYSQIAIEGGKIAVVSNSIVPPLPPNLPPGAGVYPGFIDSHSHAISLRTAQSKDAKGRYNWVSLANVNVMELPSCGSPDILGSVECYTPVTTQATAEKILKEAPVNSAGWVLGWNYEPSRLECPPNYGFQCPNTFETLPPGAVLDRLSTLRQDDAPILVASESGHLVYVNRKALAELNICTPDNTKSDCHEPIYNPETETGLAGIAGQLDEDLALYAISYVENKLADAYAAASYSKKDQPVQYDAKLLEFFSKQIRSSLDAYSTMGYTTVQEGAAGAGLIQIYMAAAKVKPFPVTMAFLEYDGTTSCDFAGSVRKAGKLQRELNDGKYDMFIAGMKVYADGSNQGFTGDMGSTVPYRDLPQVFRDPNIFKQPYTGLPDYGPAGLSTAVQATHLGGFPFWVHTNGRRAQTNVLDVLEKNKDAALRDVIVHFATPTKDEVARAAKAGLGATFLINDFYYFYQAVCEQVVGFEATRDMYPAKWAQETGMKFGIHSDVTVTPAPPIFGMYVAVERPVEKNWLPPLKPPCDVVPKGQAIDRLQAMRAYTSDAAWLYGREKTAGNVPGIGSLQIGFAGDLVVLWPDPLDPATDLTKVNVLLTVHKGNIVYTAPDAVWTTAWNGRAAVKEK